jgi:hypothetical protein
MLSECGGKGGEATHQLSDLSLFLYCGRSMVRVDQNLIEVDDPSSKIDRCGYLVVDYFLLHEEHTHTSVLLCSLHNAHTTDTRARNVEHREATSNVRALSRVVLLVVCFEPISRSGSDITSVLQCSDTDHPQSNQNTQEQSRLMGRPAAATTAAPARARAAVCGIEPCLSPGQGTQRSSSSTSSFGR